MLSRSHGDHGGRETRVDAGDGVSKQSPSPRTSRRLVPIQEEGEERAAWIGAGRFSALDCGGFPPLSEPDAPTITSWYFLPSCFP